MNDNDLSAALSAIHEDRMGLPAPPSLHRSAWAVPDSETPHQRGWLPPIFTGRFHSMFSATRFVAAAAIVALFGGFLLTGVLTTQQGDEMIPAAVTTSPSPMTTDELLSGFVTEEVEPGVLRVVNDGVRDLTRSPDPERGQTEWGNIVAGLDGSVWVVLDDGFYRLGGVGTHEYPDGAVGFWLPPPGRDFHVGPNGDIWGLVGTRSFDGEKWTRHGKAPKGELRSIEVQPDGTVWAAWVDGRDKPTFARLEDGGWQVFEGPSPRTRLSGLSVSDSGDVSIYGGGKVMRLDREGGWERLPPPSEDEDVAEVEFAPDGTLWVRWAEDDTSGCESVRWGAPNVLARFDGTRWAEFDCTDGVPIMGGGGQGLEAGFFRASPDGSVWLQPQGAEQETPRNFCDGIANFDGQSLTRYLPGRCIYAIDVGPDGSVWLHAGEGADFKGSGGAVLGPIETYVITPEAVVATE